MGGLFNFYTSGSPKSRSQATALIKKIRFGIKYSMSFVEKQGLTAGEGEQGTIGLLAPVPNQPVYHQSEIHTFLKCGKMWEFRYARGLKLPPRGAMTLGSAVDQAVSLNLSQKIYSGEDVSEEQVLDSFSADFDARLKETDWQEEDPGAQKDVGVRLVEAHHRVVAPQIKPESVQEKFLIRTDGGYDLGGTIDFTEQSGMVGDTKTSRLAYNEQALNKNIQATMYDFAYEALRGRKAAGFRFDVLIKPSTTSPKAVPRVQQVHAKLGQDDRNWLFDTVAHVDKAIQAGIAMPASEGSWYCSPKWCGYWNMCKGRKK
jgi:hypothetical protein